MCVGVIAATGFICVLGVLNTVVFEGVCSVSGYGWLGHCVKCAKLKLGVHDV